MVFFLLLKPPSFFVFKGSFCPPRGKVSFPLKNPHKLLPHLFSPLTFSPLPFLFQLLSFLASGGVVTLLYFRVPGQCAPASCQQTLALRFAWRPRITVGWLRCVAQQGDKERLWRGGGGVWMRAVLSRVQRAPSTPINGFALIKPPLLGGNLSLVRME